VIGLGDKIEIEQLYSVDKHLHELSDLLIRVVEMGASIGFLPPMKIEDAMSYWEAVLKNENILIVAKLNNQIVGSVQLQLSAKQNGQHRAELAKLMTHPTHRRNGIGRLLMQQAEKVAIKNHRTLIVLDTREGDPSNKLYTSLGYMQVGRIPAYAKSADGQYDATLFYYKITN